MEKRKPAVRIRLIGFGGSGFFDDRAAADRRRHQALSATPASLSSRSANCS
jgi:hypothetical protein